MKEKAVTNSQADATLDSLITGKVIKAPDYDHLCQSSLNSNNLATGNGHQQNLTDSEIKLLEAIIKSPMLPSTEYIKLAHISPNTLSKKRNDLLEQSYIKEHLVSNNRGRPAKVWEPTEKAIEIITGING